MNGSIQSLKQQIPEGIASLEELNKRISAMETDIQKFDKSLNECGEKLMQLGTAVTQNSTQTEGMKNQLKENELALTKTHNSLVKESSKAGFGDLEEVKISLKDSDERANLEKAVQEWKDERVRLDSALERAKKRINKKKKPEIELLRQRKKEAETIFHQLLKDIAELSGNIKNNKKLFSTIEATQKKIEKLAVNAQLFENLFAIASGKNDKSQTLQTYILTSYLEDVIMASNRRLSILTGERYELLLNNNALGAGLHGLDLDILDNNTGVSRRTNTLSGGEMFLTSLALALGLADVVTMHSGAVKIDAMFIDEGFGSLDEQTLEVAIDALNRLRMDGRMIGIISHVNELKERIPVKLEVVKGKHGSTVRWI